jgi:hypothetical protein
MLRYLPLRGRFYDQTWAIGALTNIEGVPPPEFLDPALWTEGTHALDPWRGIQLFKDIVELTNQHRMMLP